ncbi:protein of unknown function [Rubritalea squalenifaciens DSM 18772]|uniref:GYF domain-containing protein n=1 Tax=Rubritalea squalenifaciens DSM 18772 TaxID=1123071 RepID=A0A1M6GHM4_9BACT|nr:DUF4339 domain-containing protein [Rubritalea squalenifaciens]SHJ09393.1 protein of unknown function [Rubritalea squalenifaciens DSM 18772]
MADVYYYLGADNEPVGPLPLTELERFTDLGVITGETLVACAGGDDWLPLDEVVGLKEPMKDVLPSLPRMDQTEGVKTDLPESLKHATWNSDPSAEASREQLKSFVSLKFWNSIEKFTLAGVASFLLLHIVLMGEGIIPDGLLILGMLVTLAVFGIMGLMHIVVFFRCWRSIPAQFRTMGPRKAVYPLFIPLWHIWWYFVSLRGLVKSIESWEKHCEIESQDDSLRLATVWAALWGLTCYVFSFLLRSEWLASALYNAGCIALIFLGYRLFKPLVWRINTLRGEPILEGSWLGALVAGQGAAEKKRTGVVSASVVITLAALLGVFLPNYVEEPQAHAAANPQVQMPEYQLPEQVAAPVIPRQDKITEADLIQIRLQLELMREEMNAVRARLAQLGRNYSYASSQIEADYIQREMNLCRQRETQISMKVIEVMAFLAKHSDELE